MNEELLNLEKEVKDLTTKIDLLKTEIGKIIIGQEETIEQLLITFLAGGHALLEGVPGLAKTLMIRTLSDAASAFIVRKPKPGGQSTIIAEYC